MFVGRCLLARPALAEVRAMLHRIKCDNMERVQSNRLDDNFEQKVFDLPHVWHSVNTNTQPLQGMGSFTAMPKVVPNVDVEDNDVKYTQGRETMEQCLERCRNELKDLPQCIHREWRRDAPKGPNTIRVLQWNLLSQALGSQCDNFVRCPASALEWRTRRFRLLEELVRHQCDILCLQEVDHFAFLAKSLRSLGYVGHFFPKPDSPCVYLPKNSGPDGCALFFRLDKFELIAVETRVIEVWHVESNQVVLLMTLRHRGSGAEVCVATTHLKARTGALLSTLRNEQGKDLLELVSERANENCMDNDGRRVIITGDFNAEPHEPVYKTITDPDNLPRLVSAYATGGSEASYTTWKVRGDGEHRQTLDYIFCSAQGLKVRGVLEPPKEENVGKDRLPNDAFPSDHISLVADIDIVGHNDRQ